MDDTDFEYRKIQELIGESSFSIILPKKYATDIGLDKGDFVKVRKIDASVLSANADGLAWFLYKSAKIDQKCRGLYSISGLIQVV